MDLDLKDKVAIVTGAGSNKGIGNAMAHALAGEGVHVAVTDIMQEGIDALADKLANTGVKTLAVQADQSQYEQVKDAVARVTGEFGKVDILVNCAALTGNFGTISKMPPEAWTREINVNLNGPYYWTREVLPLMKKNAWGRIINISSVAGLFGTTGIPAYSVSKGGLHLLTKQTAREVARKGITANTLVLGIIATEIYERQGIGQDTVDRLVSNIPMGRMGEPSEVADAALFLCSDKAKYITGTNVLVEGGISISL
ncbi:MAG: SDR family oxidoreductase [Deltaproteobacteria bacterium]|nr:SDR family oxidoreductase [Deltaproteobacteria bacterium]